ncbi:MULTISPECIES: flagellin [Pseudomonas aeruginosa group]|uniref:Flagellin n=2 Tax=Pseudomonas aeruginosa group TaxID=136841 RepID=O86265_PSEAI|nr:MULTISPECIES: flagellin [Pseudomonas aeruginosa group]AAC28556.1 flagellin [Pseudomonas aeruginosa]ABR82534.1 A-type flagellin [Pseudomonas aeruginosa PA7]KAB0747486.1 flagellin [Pseudomonas aeruginosa]KPD30449.1 flagellin [Pseudomonas paraeruginosa]KQB33091.1 flagellin [Pseudomonas paraeruginosa]
MALTVNTNIASLNTQRNLNNSSASLNTSLQRLSTGSRINSAKDDAAGLQIANRLTSQVNGLNVATKNANDGISLAQTAEGALQQSTNILQRMRDLSLQSANGSNSDSERTALNGEVKQLQKELDRISNTTTFGGRKLLDGSFGVASFQVGSAANEIISVGIDEMSAESLNGTYFKADGGGAVTAATASGTVDIALGITGGSTVNVKVDMKGNETAEQAAAKIAAAVNDANVGIGAFSDGDTISYVSKASADGTTSAVSGVVITDTGSTGAGAAASTSTFTEANDTVAKIDISTAKGAQSAVLVIDEAIKQIDAQRADLGAVQNRFDNTINNLKNIGENVSAARGRIEDTDFAAETANLTKNQVLQQAGTAILAQANQLPQSVLSLLR